MVSTDLALLRTCLTSYRVEKSAEHNHEFLLYDKLSLTELDSLVVDLKGNKQIDRQTKILETTTTHRSFCTHSVSPLTFAYRIVGQK
jgi:hypothetical protein